MIRDPFYREIVARLADRMDPESFEQCVVYLLPYPTLVPVRGGLDSGMDGAVGNDEGEPYPLVTTTAENVIGNFTRSLKSFVESGSPQRKVVLATSQSLTPIKRSNIYKRARQLGFTLINIHERDAIANLLYRSPPWCKDLLGIIGSPSPLSIVPRSKRLRLDKPLIGREEALSWLENHSGDKLIVGQPGIGKTSLLHNFARNHEGLFVVSSNPVEIAGALRSEGPLLLILDDAHSQLDLLLKLKHLREEVGANYCIVASSWPGAKEAVAHSLNLVTKDIHELDLLTRDDIVQVVKSTGIEGPDRLIREIVDQAEGRPGLAVTLADICLRGDVNEVVPGNVLAEELLYFFKEVIGTQASAILAGFAVGGDIGMPMRTVADAFNCNILEFQGVVNTLAAGGVIWQKGDNLSVRPPALRYALVRDHFFIGAKSLDICTLLEQAPSMREATLTLIRTKARGAKIPDDFLRDLVSRVSSQTVLNGYAWLGRDESTWILQHYPEELISVAEPALHHICEISIPLLMERAIADKRPLHAHPDHPLRSIEDWILEANPISSEALSRRETLFRVIVDWLSDNNDVDIAFRVLEFALSPEFERRSTDPGLGNKITISKGFVCDSDKIELMEKWPEVVQLLKRYHLGDWQPVREVVHQWAFPSRSNIPISQQTYDTMKGFAAKMLTDLAHIAEHRLGVLRWVKETSEVLGISLNLAIDRGFETLFPQDPLRQGEDYREILEMQRQAVQNLASEWEHVEPRQVVDRVSQLEQEARLAGFTWPRWTPLLFEALSIISHYPPTLWISLMIRENSLSDCLLPFFARAMRDGSPGWVEMALSCLEVPALRGVVISLVLATPDIPEVLVDSTFKQLKGRGKLVETHVVRNETNPALVIRLLQHEDSDIVCATAEGLWYSDEKETIPDAFLEYWETAVIKYVKRDHVLCSVFCAKPELGSKWLSNRIAQNSIETYRFKETMQVLARVLDTSEKGALLRHLPPNNDFDKVVIALVNGDVGIFRNLLTFPHLKQFHLLALCGMPSGPWLDMAKCALDAGYRHEEIVSATFGKSYGWSGKESDMWEKWIRRFKPLCSAGDADTHRLGELGITRATMRKERAVERERNEAVFGLG